MFIRTFIKTSDFLTLNPFDSNNKNEIHFKINGVTHKYKIVFKIEEKYKSRKFPDQKDKDILDYFLEDKQKYKKYITDFFLCSIEDGFLKYESLNIREKLKKKWHLKKLKKNYEKSTIIGIGIYKECDLFYDYREKIDSKSNEEDKVSKNSESIDWKNPMKIMNLENKMNSLKIVNPV